MGITAGAARTLSIGGATYDLFLGVGRTNAKDLVKGEVLLLPVGHKITVDSVVEACGGGANNTSVGLSRLGCRASFCGIVGDDQWGQKLLANMQREGVDTQLSTVVEDETSSFSLVLSLPGGERTILYAAGVNEHLHDATFGKHALSQTDAVYLNHLCDASCMIEDDIIEMVAKHRGVRVTWNPGGSQIEAGMKAKDKAALLKNTTLLILNKEEAGRFTRAKDVRSALKALSAAGAKNICITDGKRGTYATDGTHFYHCPVRTDVTVVDTTGAGDAFGVGATWALLEGRSLPTAMTAGTLNAASVVSVIGAQPGLLTRDRMVRELKRHTLTVSVLPW